MPLTKVDPKMFGGGAVLQVVYSSTSSPSAISVAANTWYDSGISCSITPASTNSKVAIIGSICFQNHYSATNSPSTMRLVRDSTAITSQMGSHTSPSNGENLAVSQSIAFLDSPATTAAVTYKIQVLNKSATTIYVNRTYDSNNGNFGSTMILQEIAG
jgi:hypothetical protein